MKQLTQVLLACIFVFGFLNSFSQELGNLDFPYTANGVTVTMSGGGGTYGGAYNYLCPPNGTKANSISMNGGSSGGITCTFTFSAAVNDVIIREGAINAGNVTTISVNSGSPSLTYTACYPAGSNSGGVITWPSTGPNYTDANIKVHSTSSYTTLTVNITGDYITLTMDMTGSASTAPADPTSITPSASTVCNGTNVTLTANGAVGTVYWFTSGCNTSGQIATGNPITVSPSSTTIYYARNNNGAWSSGCANTIITVNPQATAPSSASGTPTFSGANFGADLAFGGATTGGSGTLTYYWVVGTSPSALYGVDPSGNTTATSYSWPNGLAASTTYYLRVFANNGLCANTGYFTSASFRTASVMTYLAGSHGTFSGGSPLSQTIANGGNGSAITAVSDADYHFVNWSDGSTANPRTDLNVTSSASVTANFAADILAFGTQPVTSIAGAIIPVTVKITNTAGATINTATHSITLSLQNNPSGATLGGVLTVTAINGVATFSDLHIDKTGTGYTLKAITFGGVIVTQPISSAFNITPGVIDHFTVAGISDPVFAGVATSPVVTAYDAYNNVKTDYTGTITFSSDDLFPAVLPANYTFLPGDLGVKTFTNGVILKTTGERSVTVTGDAKTGSQTAITVNPANFYSFDLVVNGPITAGTPFTVTATAKDQFNNVKTDYIGFHNVSWTSNATLAPRGTARILPANGDQTFASGVMTVGGFTLFRSDETPTITIADGSLGGFGTTSSITVHNGALDNFLVVAGQTQLAGVPFDVTVTARDAYWNTDITYLGKIRFKSSNDVNVHFPVDYTYVGGDNGVHTFTGGLNIHESGSYWVRVGATADLTKTGQQEGIVVSPGLFDPAHSSLTVNYTTRIAGEHVLVTLIPRDANGNLLCAGTIDNVPLNVQLHSSNLDYDGEIVEVILKDAQTIGGNKATGTYTADVRVTNATTGWNVIRAYYNGVLFLQQPLIDVSPAATAYFSLNAPADITAGTRAAYTVSRFDQFNNPRLVGAETAYLYSNSSGNKAFYDAVTDGNVITSLSIADGTSSANFWYYDEKAGTWTITASDNSPADGATGVIDATDVIIVSPAPTDHFTLNSPPDITAGGLTRAAYTVTRFDQFNNLQLIGSQLVYLYTSSTGPNARFYNSETASAPANIISTITIGDGSSAANFWYYDEKTNYLGPCNNGEWMITASDATPAADGNIGIDDATDLIKVIPTSIGNAPNSFSVEGLGVTHYYGDPVTITVKALDTYGNVKTNYNGTITFSNTDVGSVNPPDFTFQVSDCGEHTFDNGVTFSAVSTAPAHWWITVLNSNGDKYGGQVFAILPRPITITASNQSKCFGVELTLGTTAFTTTSMATGESIASVTLASDGATASAPVTTYNIIPSVAVAGSGTFLSNYTITYANGTLTVNALTGAADAITGSATFLQNTNGIGYSIATIDNATGYVWSYSGSGVTITGTGTSVTLAFSGSATNGTLSVHGTGICGDGTTAELILIANKTVNLTSVLLEGLNNGGGTMIQARNASAPQYASGIADHITVELHDASIYGTIVYTASNVELTTSGTATFIVPFIYNGSYYITIKHRNSIETTTASAVSFSSNTITQSFGTPANVYGANLKHVGSYYLIYGGDVNQDGIVDASDMGIVQNHSISAAVGYLDDDCNGDGLIDGSDMLIVGNNSNMAIGVIIPTP